MKGFFTALFAIKEFAEKAHGSQLRKYTNEPYINHPIAVMELLRHHTHYDVLFLAALLHDVIEDTEVTAEDLSVFLRSVLPQQEAGEVLFLVIELTDVYTKESYSELNREKRKEMERARHSDMSSYAQTIKYADIIDNSKSILKHDPKFAKVFVSECDMDLRGMNRGNTDLRWQAQEALNATEV